MAKAGAEGQASQVASKGVAEKSEWGGRKAAGVQGTGQL